MAGREMTQLAGPRGPLGAGWGWPLGQPQKTCLPLPGCFQGEGRLPKQPDNPRGPSQALKNERQGLG